MLTVLFGLISAALYALNDLVAQQLARRVGVVRILRWVLVTSTILVVPLALAVEGLPATSAQWKAVAFSAAAGAFYLGTWFSLLRALVVGSLSLVAPLSSLEGLFTAVYALASGDSFHALLGVGIALAIGGSLLAAVHGRAESARGALWALLTSALWSLALFFFNEAGDVSFLSQAAWSRLSGLVLLVPITALVAMRSRARGREGAPLAPPRTGGTRLVAGFVAAGLLDLGGLSATTLALARGPLAVAGVTLSQYSTVAVVLGLVFLKERPLRHQLVGVACTLMAVGILGAVG